MKKPHVSIAALMLIVLLCALGFAALKDPTELWVSVALTATLIVLLTGILGVIFGRGRSRTAWTGLVLFGWSYFFVAGFPVDRASPVVLTEISDAIKPRLLTTVLLERLRKGMHPYDEKAHSALPGDEQQAFGIKYIESATNFSAIGDSIATLLFGLFGAVMGRILASRVVRSEDGASSS